MKCIFSLDDFCKHHESVVHYLQILAEYFPKFKASMFTIPCYGKTPIVQHKEWYDSLPFQVEHILHGYFHTRHEFEKLDRIQCEHFIQEGIDRFTECGFPIVKGFKAPNWRYNNELVGALKEKGFWLATYTPNHNTTEVPCYNWNWDIGDPIPNVDFLHAHGHVHNISGPGKGIEVSMNNILKLPKYTEFYFIGEYMDGTL